MTAKLDIYKCKHNFYIVAFLYHRLDPSWNVPPSFCHLASTRQDFALKRAQMSLSDAVNLKS